jgi:hypothetical protein
MLPISFVRRRREPGDLTAGRIAGFLASHYQIPASARNKHLHIIGRTGQGKSKALESFVYQDIRNGLGGALIDPHSSLIDNVLRYLITDRVLDDPAIRTRLIYIQPTRKDYIIGFNVLATPDEPYMVASAVIEAFRRTWTSLGEAPNFTNVMRNSLLLLIKTHQTLIDFPRLYEDTEWRDRLLVQAGDPNLTAFFHNRFDRWGREGRLMLESSLNKVTEYILNPYLSIMLGQRDMLDLKAVMDEGKILFLDLGQLDPETRRLLGSLLVTLIELIMRKRDRTTLWPLTIDEFAQFMASEGSATTLAHVLSEARKYGIGLCAAHQTLSQLTPTMLGALGNTDTRIVFGVGRYDAEWLSKVVGRVDTQAVKEAAKTETQHAQYDPLPEQWEKWVDSLRLQPPRHAWVASTQRVPVQIVTLTIPQYTATDKQVEAIKAESLGRYGIRYDSAKAQIERPKTSTRYDFSETLMWEHDTAAAR